jgi:hypothetical protein
MMLSISDKFCVHVPEAAMNLAEVVAEVEGLAAQVRGCA